MAAPAAAAAAALLSCIIFFFVPLLFEGSGFPIRIIYCLLDGEEITRECVPVCVCELANVADCRFSIAKIAWGAKKR